MVQIRRNRLLTSRQTRSIRRTLVDFMRFLAISAAIPLLFAIRYILPRSQIKLDDLNSLGSSEKETRSSPFSLFKRRPPSSSSSMTGVRRALQFLERLDWRNTREWQHEFSDVVLLDHCDLTSTPVSFFRNFTEWAMPLLVNASDSVPPQNSKSMLRQSRQREAAPWQLEWALQLLELYLYHKPQAAVPCHFENYLPTVPNTMQTKPFLGNLESFLRELQQAPEEGDRPTRVVVTILAHQDIAQLRRLIGALLPDADAVNEKGKPAILILVHLERRVSPEYEATLAEISTFHQPYVWIVKFGSILYGTDSASQVQWRIQNWLLRTVQFTAFDYYVSLDGASFPLGSFAEMMQLLDQATLQATKQKPNDGNHVGGAVWLGTQLAKGVVLTPENTNQGAATDHLLRQTRLLFTQGSSAKYTVRLPRALFSRHHPDAISLAPLALTRKSHSGNTAVYSRSVLQALVQSSDVQRLFALSKYGAYCCLEERTWISALALINYPQVDNLQSAVFQVYGGETNCQSSKSNAVLTREEAVCYKLDDARMVQSLQTTTQEMTSNATAFYFRGNETWSMLQKAKSQGVLFARKFDSDSAMSMQLLTTIESELWQKLPSTTDGKS